MIFVKLLEECVFFDSNLIDKVVIAFEHIPDPASYPAGLHATVAPAVSVHDKTKLTRSPDSNPSLSKPVLSIVKEFNSVRHFVATF